MDSSVFSFNIKFPTLINESFVSDDMELSNDHLLMIEIAAGNQEAMEKLVDKWKNAAFRFFNRSLNNQSDAEDLTQQLFIKIYLSASKYKPRAKFSTFFFTVARNLLIDQIKKNNRRSFTNFDEGILNFDQIELTNESKELHEILDIAMQEIPEFQRTAILLRVQKDLSYKEISDIMKVSESRVKTWIYRARVYLKKFLEEEF